MIIWRNQDNTMVFKRPGVAGDIQEGKITENVSNVDTRQDKTQEADINQTSFDNNDVSDLFQKEIVNGECLEVCRTVQPPLLIW